MYSEKIFFLSLLLFSTHTFSPQARYPLLSFLASVCVLEFQTGSLPAIRSDFSFVRPVKVSCNHRYGGRFWSDLCRPVDFPPLPIHVPRVRFVNFMGGILNIHRVKGKWSSLKTSRESKRCRHIQTILGTFVQGDNRTCFFFSLSFFFPWQTIAQETRTFFYSHTRILCRIPTVVELRNRVYAFYAWICVLRRAYL